MDDSLRFQIYAIIPLAFLLYREVGRRTFLAILLGVWAMCCLARLSFIQMGAPDTTIWVTPFLHPDTVLAGLALSLCSENIISKRSALAVAALGAAALLALPQPEHQLAWAMLIYPLAAIVCCCLVQLTRIDGGLRTTLSHPVLAYLGKISFGLYVFHFPAIAYTGRIIERLGLPPNYLLTFTLSLVLTLCAAYISYRWFERYWLLQKARAAVLATRPI